MTAAKSSSLRLLEWAEVALLYVLLYPPLLLVGFADRLLTHAMHGEAVQLAPSKSILAEAADKIAVAVTYALTI